MHAHSWRWPSARTTTTSQYCDNVPLTLKRSKNELTVAVTGLNFETFTADRFIFIISSLAKPFKSHSHTALFNHCQKESNSMRSFSKQINVFFSLHNLRFQATPTERDCLSHCKRKNECQGQEITKDYVPECITNCRNICNTDRKEAVKLSKFSSVWESSKKTTWNNQL